MHKRIQIGNLNGSVDDRGLEALFAPHGEVLGATVSRHPDTGHSTGVGFVEMKRDKDGNAAVLALHGCECNGAVLSVCWSKLSSNAPPEIDSRRDL